MDNKSISSSYF